jgi:tRNA pseudouridine38-40 synthase
MKYFLHVAYNGTDYSGWQRQPDAFTVQQTIEEKLASIFKKFVTVYGCGRTDAGVHASQYILHIVLEEELKFDLVFRLNKHLPRDIRVYDVLPMESKQHAMYDAISRTYDYYIHLKEDPVLHQVSSFYEDSNLDFEAMKKAVAMLPLYQEYRSFCKQPDVYKHTLCKVSQAELFVNPEQTRLRLTISSNRFIRGMIRFIVAFVLQVGRKKITVVEFEQLLTNELEFKEKVPAFPNGLFLSKIEYPYLKIPQRQDITHLLKIGLTH